MSNATSEVFLVVLADVLANERKRMERVADEGLTIYPRSYTQLALAAKDGTLEVMSVLNKMSKS